MNEDTATLVVNPTGSFRNGDIYCSNSYHFHLFLSTVNSKCSMQEVQDADLTPGKAMYHS